MIRKTKAEYFARLKLERERKLEKITHRTKRTFWFRHEPGRKMTV